MIRRFGALTVLAVCVLLLGSAVQAVVWTPSLLSNSINLETALLTPSYSSSGGSYMYSYDLKNTTTTDEITGFTLTFPTAVSVTSFTDFLVTPTGWMRDFVLDNNQVEWVLLNPLYSLKSTYTMTVGFTTKFAPSSSKVVFAACQDSWGFSGNTFGPIPEPGSLVALFTGLVGLVGLKLRRR